MKDKMYHIRRPFSYPKKWIKVTVRGGHQRIPVRKVADISTRTISDPIGRKENDILKWKEYIEYREMKGHATDHTLGTSNLRLLCLCRKNSGKQKPKGALTGRSQHAR